MAKNVAKVKKLLANLPLGVDYDQPTSLEDNMDVLADTLLKHGFCPKFKKSANSGYLQEVLEKMEETNDAVANLREQCSVIDGILGNIEYSGLNEEDADELEIVLNEFVHDFAEFLDGNN